MALTSPKRRQFPDPFDRAIERMWANPTAESRAFLAELARVGAAMADGVRQRLDATGRLGPEDVALLNQALRVLGQSVEMR